VVVVAVVVRVLLWVGVPELVLVPVSALAALVPLATSIRMRITLPLPSLAALVLLMLVAVPNAWSISCWSVLFARAGRNRKRQT
jgi:hypothetical protein